VEVPEESRGAKRTFKRGRTRWKNKTQTEATTGEIRFVIDF
jgi:hypothetical protein